MATIRELQARFTAQADGLRNAMRTMAKDVKAFGKDSQKSVKDANSEFRKFEQTLGGLQDEIKETKRQMGDSWDDSELKELERAIQKVKDELRTTGTVGEESMEDFRRVLRESRADLANLGEGNPFSNLVAQIEVTESSVQALNQLELSNLQREFDQVTQNVNESNTNIDTFRSNLGTLEDALRNSTNVQGFEDLNRILRDVQEELRTTGQVSVENMSALNQALGVSQTELQQLGNSNAFQDLIQQINQVQSSMQQMGNQGAQDLQQIETAAQQAQQEINQLDSVQLDGLDTEMDSISDGFDEAGASSQEAEGTIVGAFGGIKAGALAVVGAIAGVVAGVAGLIKTGDDLQRALNNLQVQTGASNKEMEGLESHLINIYRNNYGESFDDIAVAMSTVKTATKLTGEELEKATTQAILLRDSFEWEIDLQMKTAQIMMKQFGYTAEESLNILAQGRQEMGSTADDLLETFWEYSGAFSDLGFNGEQAMNMISNAVAAGARNTDVAGDSINEFATRIMDGSDLTRESLQAAGLNADEIINKFKKGGKDGQEAFQQVTKAISAIGDTATKEQTAVGLFGTLAEDVGVDAVLALGNINGEANKAVDTLGKIDSIKYNSIGEAIAGVGRIIMADFVIPLQQQLMPTVNKMVNAFKDNLPVIIDNLKAKFASFNQTIEPFKTAVKGIFEMFRGNNIEGIDILTKLGLSTDQIVAINTTVNMVKQTFEFLMLAVQRNMAGMKTAVTTLFNFLAPYIMPLLQSIVSFIGEKVAQITKFWDENGAQITEAAQNAFNLILGIIKFVMPAVLAIIEMVWNNIKGVINGALNIIMGAIKIFAGLFTGDFSKMWEGIKQLFIGAIEFVWNLISLLMFGRIISAIKSFATAGVTAFRAFVDDIVNFFRNLDSRVTVIVGKFVNYLKNSWNTASSNASTIFTNMKNTIARIWDDIVNGAKALPGKIGDGIKNMAGKAADGVKSLANNLMSNLGLGVNGVVGGVNWILGKVGVDKKIPKWEVPQYAKGTGGHPGGPMIIGDGGQQELVRYPDGTMYLSPNKDMLVPDAPEGTTVLSGPDTKKLLSMGVPGYANGIGDFFKWLTEGPKKLIKNVWEKFIPKMSGISGIFSDVAKGAVTHIKDKAFDFLKSKLEGFGSFGGTGNVPGNVSSWIRAAMGITGAPDSWFSSLVTMAMKESGGRTGPETINKWDSNWTRGTPSMGLMQTIRPTFEAYKVKGLNDIMNPIHNAAAAIRYIMARYGTVFNTPGIKSMMMGGPYKGYFEGARVAAKQLAWIAERGAEYVIPTDGGERAYDLWNAAGKENGFTQASENKGGNMDKFVEAVSDLASRPVILEVSGREIAKTTYQDSGEFQNYQAAREAKYFKGR